MKYKVEKVNIEDCKKHFVRILSENMPSHGDFNKRIEWIYENNPIGKPYCWLLKEEDSNEYIGCATLFIRDFILNGEKIRAGIVGDTMVDKKHRTLGPALKMQRSVIELVNKESISLIYGFPNEFSEVVNLRIGYKSLGDCIRLVKVVRINDILERLGISIFRKSISKFFNFFLFLIIYLKTRKNNTKYTYEDNVTPDENFDLFYNFPGQKKVNIGIRNKRFLIWRFLNHPYVDHHFFTLKNHNDDLLGYIVYRKKESTIVIVDILSQNHYSDIIDYFLYHTIKEQKNIYYISFTTLENSYLDKFFKSKQFKKRDSVLKFVVFKKEMKSDEALFNISKWHIVSGDSDT